MKLFKGQNGGIPLILYLLPLIIGIIGVGIHFSIGSGQRTVKKGIQAASMAVGLQKDINYIATKTKASEVFDLSKKEIG